MAIVRRTDIKKNLFVTLFFHPIQLDIKKNLSVIYFLHYDTQLVGHKEEQIHDHPSFRYYTAYKLIKQTWATFINHPTPHQTNPSSPTMKTFLSILLLLVVPTATVSEFFSIFRGMRIVSAYITFANYSFFTIAY